MGIFSNRMRYIQELKIDGKEVKDQKDNDEDFKLGTEEEPPVEDNPPTDVDNDKTEDEEDYNIPDDDTEKDAEEEPPTDVDNDKTEDEEDYNIPDDDTEENPENPEGNPEDNPNDETGNDDDFSMGDSDNPEDNSEGNPENPEGNPEDNPDGTEDIAGGKNEVQELEDKLFADLSPEQMSIKHIELKQQYIDLFDAISDIVSRVNKITKTTDNSNVIEFVSNKMIELKDLVHFYLNNTYTTKTYIENTMNYQQYIVILNTINKMLKEIIPKTGKTN